MESSLWSASAGPKGDSEYFISTPKSREARKVTVPPHIRADIEHHLNTYVAKSPDACCSAPHAAAATCETRYSESPVSSRRAHYQAVQAAVGREMAKTRGVEYTIRNQDRMIDEKNSCGGDPYPPEG